MRPQTVRLASATFSPWIVLDHLVQGFVVGLGVKLSSNGNLTYSVQHTFDNILQDEVLNTSLTRSTTTATLTKTNHGLSVADYIKVSGAGAPFDGEYAVASVVDQNSITYTVLNSGLTTSTNQPRFVYARLFTHLTLAAQTTSQQGNYVAPPIATRLIVSSYTAGYADFTVIQGGLQ